MICAKTSHRGKILDSKKKRIDHIIYIFYFKPTHIRQPLDIIGKSLFLNLDCFIRTKRWKYFDFHCFICRNRFVPTQIITRIVCCTHRFYIKHSHQFPGAAFCKHLIAFIVNLICILLTERFFNPKHSAKLQMTPVIQRISNQSRQNFCKRTEFLPRVCILRNKFFRNTAKTHLPPFVMITPKPHLRHILKPSVLRNLLRIDMTVIINDRHLFCHFMIQPSGSFCR